MTTTKSGHPTSHAVHLAMLRILTRRPELTLWFHYDAEIGVLVTAQLNDDHPGWALVTIQRPGLPDVSEFLPPLPLYALCVLEYARTLLEHGCAQEGWN